jgi:hypothetical protein
MPDTVGEPETRFDKEKVYDEQISPIMTKIIEIAKREKISFACTYAIRDDGEPDGWLFCSTVHDHHHDKQIPYLHKIEELRYAMFPRPITFSMVIMNKKGE